MNYIVTLNGKEYEVELERGEVSAVLRGNVDPGTPAAASAPAPAAAAAGAAGGEAVTAPIPGVVLQVRCRAGQAVKRGDVLFILEAMKMENEVFAPRDGIVSAVAASQGATVETGAVLCTL